MIDSERERERKSRRIKLNKKIFVILIFAVYFHQIFLFVIIDFYRILTEVEYYYNGGHQDQKKKLFIN